MFKYLQQNPQLGIITQLGGSAAVTIAGFGIYRALNGQVMAALVDLAIVLLVALPVLYANLTKRAAGAGAFLCIGNSLCCLLASWFLGPVAVSWVYLVLMTNFFITGSRLAACTNLFLIAAMLTVPDLFPTLVGAFSAAASASLVTLFAWLFAVRVGMDRTTLEQVASLDVLTSLPNRRMMEQALTETVGRKRTGNDNYGLIIIDIDHFKAVNDSYGHAAGDAAIADLAAILRHQMRKNDQVFRFGGEEFVALVSVDSSADLYVAAERIRTKVRSALRGPGGRITVSIGASLLGDEERWQDWFSLADTALYSAKGAGRDSSVVAG
ncbi:MAG: GGDEF domain-containing protein [Pseudoxanthomonas sp.]